MRYRLPNLHAEWPFPKTTNPFQQQVASESSRWINSFKLFTPKQQEKFFRINTGLLNSLAYPHHSAQHLRVASDLINALFAVDDVSDYMDGKEAGGLVNVILEDFSNPERVKAEDDSTHPLVNAHRSLLRTIVNVASPYITRRFVKGYAQYLKATAEEARDRENRAIKLSVDEYLKLRRDTSAVKPSLDMILLPLDIPDHILDDPKMRNLEIIANDLISVANDVFSFNVEQARGDIHNMVIVIMGERGVGVQEAMDIVGQWYRKTSQDFIKAMHDLPTANSEVQADIQKYAWGIGNWVTANYEWSFESERFWGITHLDEDAKAAHDIFVELMPQSSTVGVI